MNENNYLKLSIATFMIAAYVFICSCALETGIWLSKSRTGVVLPVASEDYFISSGNWTNSQDVVSVSSGHENAVNHPTKGHGSGSNNTAIGYQTSGDVVCIGDGACDGNTVQAFGTGTVTSNTLTVTSGKWTATCSTIEGAEKGTINECKQ